MYQFFKYRFDLYNMYFNIKLFAYLNNFKNIFKNIRFYITILIIRFITTKYILSPV